jgi:RHS repeat-associated protein
VDKYWYDANGQRIKKQNADGEFTYYVNKFYEVDNGNATSYFFRDEERIAKQTAEGMEWYLSDHLGSTTLLINESGAEVERTEYFPYGQVQSGGLEKYGFTGQENDADTELMYYGARYYSPEYRVFVQPDTMLPDPYNPQALNRYAYALNNPVKYTDPSGHYVESAIDIAFLAMDLNDIRTGNANKWTYIGLGADVVCLALPGVTGGRLAVKALEEGVTHGDELLGAGKAASNFIDNADTLKDTGNAVGTYGGTLKSFDSIPESLLGGEANTYVYYGVKDGENVYVGITNNPAKRAYQHMDRFDKLTVMNEGKPLTRNQARAIEQASILNKPSFENKINSISPMRDYYNEAVEWGQKWLKENS